MFVMQTFSRFILMIVGLSLAACETPSQVKNPAKAYASTEVFLLKNGVLLVQGDWDYIEYTTTTVLPRMVRGGACRSNSVWQGTLLPLLSKKCRTTTG
jgi:hypothetical protein